jgi:hypothetical protein
MLNMNTTEKRRSAYEKGRKKGEALVTRGQSTVADWRVYWRESAEAVARVIGWPVEKLTGRVLAFHRERLDAVPDLTRYPERRGYRGLIIEEERGMKDAGAEEILIALSKSLHFWRATRLSEETCRSFYRHSLIEGAEYSTWQEVIVVRCISKTLMTLWPKQTPSPPPVTRRYSGLSRYS